MSEVIKREPPWELDPNLRLIVTAHDEHGNETYRWEGPNEIELWDQHVNHTCSSDCNFCFHEADIYAKENGIVWGTYEEFLAMPDSEPVCKPHGYRAADQSGRHSGNDQGNDLYPRVYQNDPSTRVFHQQNQKRFDDGTWDFLDGTE